jgi:hypothetical protein
MVTLILNRLRQEDEVVEGYSPERLVKNWPPAFTEWSTKSVRDAFYASPQFPRLLKPEAVKEMIARGIANGVIAYVGRYPDGIYEPFYYQRSVAPSEIDIADDVFIIKRETAEAYKKSLTAPAPAEKPELVLSPVPENVAYPIPVAGTHPVVKDGRSDPPSLEENTPLPAAIARLRWSGNIPPRKWTNFYMKLLTKYAAVGNSLSLHLNLEISPEGGLSQQDIDEIRMALRELELNGGVATE